MSFNATMPVAIGYMMPHQSDMTSYAATAMNIVGYIPISRIHPHHWTGYSNI